MTTRPSPFGNETGRLPMAVFTPGTENFDALKVSKILVIGAGIVIAYKVSPLITDSVDLYV